MGIMRANHKPWEASNTGTQQFAWVIEKLLVHDTSGRLPPGADVELDFQWRSGFEQTQAEE